MIEYFFSHTPFLYFVQSFWRDEAFSVLLAMKSVPNLLYNTAQDYNPPLYYLLLHTIFLFIQKSEIGIRAPSLFFFIGTLIVAHKILTDTCSFSYKKALFFIPVIFFSPILLYYAFEARMYLLLCFSAVSSTYALLTRKHLLFIFFSLIGLYTHYFMTLVLITQFLWLLINTKSFQKNRSIYFSFIIIALGFIPWAIFVLKTKSELITSYWIPSPKGIDVFFFPVTLITGHEVSLSAYPFSFWIFMIFFFLLIAAIIYLRRRKHIHLSSSIKLIILLSCIPSICVFLLSPIRSLYLPRYLIFQAPFLLIAIAVLSNYIHKNVFIITSLAIFIFFISYLPQQMIDRKKVNLSETAQQIKRLKKTTDYVYVHELDFHTIQYYLGKDNVFIYGKTYDMLPTYIGKVLIDPNNVVLTLPQLPQRAFVVQRDGSFSIQAEL